MRFDFAEDYHFVNQYELYLIRKYHLGTGCVAIESPREFLKHLLASCPFLVSDEPRSAARFVDACMKSAWLQQPSGRIFGYKPSALEREYNRMKAEQFECLVEAESLIDHQKIEVLV